MQLEEHWSSEQSRHRETFSSVGSAQQPELPPQLQEEISTCTMGDPKCSLPRLGVSLSSWILHEPDIQVGDTTHMSYPSRHEGSGRLYDYFKRYKIKVCWPQRLKTTGHILIRSCPWPDLDRSRSFWFLELLLILWALFSSFTVDSENFPAALSSFCSHGVNQSHTWPCVAKI